MSRQSQNRQHTAPAAEPTVETPVTDPAAEAPAAETPAAETAAEPAADAAPKGDKAGFKVRSKVGLMIHPYLPFRFEGQIPVPMAEIDGWTQSQVEAQKLEVVE